MIINSIIVLCYLWLAGCIAVSSTPVTTDARLFSSLLFPAAADLGLSVLTSPVIV